MLAWVQTPFFDGHLLPGRKWPALQLSSSCSPRKSTEGVTEEMPSDAPKGWSSWAWSCPWWRQSLVSNQQFNDHQGMIPKSILQAVFDFLFGLTVKSDFLNFETGQVFKLTGNKYLRPTSPQYVSTTSCSEAFVAPIRGTDAGHFEAFRGHTEGGRAKFSSVNSVDGDEHPGSCFLAPCRPSVRTSHRSPQLLTGCPKGSHELRGTPLSLLTCAGCEYCPPPQVSL